jgi:hypothetical protein
VIIHGDGNFATLVAHSQEVRRLGFVILESRSVVPYVRDFINEDTRAALQFIPEVYDLLVGRSSAPVRIVLSGVERWIEISTRDSDLELRTTSDVVRALGRMALIAASELSRSEY